VFFGRKERENTRASSGKEKRGLRPCSGNKEIFVVETQKREVMGLG